MIQEKWKTDNAGWRGVTGVLGFLYTRAWIPRVDRRPQYWCMKKRSNVEYRLEKSLFVT